MSSGSDDPLGEFQGWDALWEALALRATFCGMACNARHYFRKVLF